MPVRVTYRADDDNTTVTVEESRSHPQHGRQERRVTQGFGNSAKARDDGLIFVHGVNHGEIKPDDILPPWQD